MSVIKAKLREQAAKFVSLRETLELMAKAGEGCTTKEAATFLYRGISKRKSLRWQTIFCGEIAEADNGYITPLLDVIVKNGGLVFSFDDFYSQSDCDQYGFLRSELIEFLSAEGIHISMASSAAPAAEKAEIPDWAKSLKAIKRFTLNQAANVLIGLDPMDERWPGDDGQRELDKAYTALAQAVEDGDLLPVAADNCDRPLFRAQDLLAWAASVGLYWCIPSDAPAVAVTPAGAADEANRERLRQLEAENARLAEQVTELQRQLQEAAAVPQQAAAERQDDDRPLATKERNTLLKLVIGMATAYHGYDPCAKRSGTAASIVSELARLGIGIEADTVRKYLKEAAETVMPADAIKQ